MVVLSIKHPVKMAEALDTNEKKVGRIGLGNFLGGVVGEWIRKQGMGAWGQKVGKPRGRICKIPNKNGISEIEKWANSG